jgi:methylglutamate dehydrogenase subunit D
MPDVALQERSPLHGLAVPGRFGARGNVAGVSIEERTMVFASVIARRGQVDALVRKVAERYGLQLPDGPRRSTAGRMTFAGVGPGQWIASADGAADVVAGLRSDLGPFAAVADQSDSRLVVRLSGPRVRDVLAKGLAVDLHRSAFKAGDVAVTLVVHIGVQIDMLDDAPTYQLAAPRSMAGSFWSWLTASAAEFGYDVVTK